MELLGLLEVNEDRLPHRTYPAVKYCERRWEELGRPTERAALIEFLDHALKFCPDVGFHYPKIFLKRLKQLQRNQWSPRVEDIGS